MQEQVEKVDDFQFVGDEPQAQEVEAVEVDEQDVEQTEEAASAEGEELELVIEDAEASPASTVEQDDIEIPDDAPNWAKQLRQGYKELARENKKLKTQQQQAVAQYEPEVFNEPFPDIADADVDFDTDKLKAKVMSWSEKKAKFDNSQSSKKAEFEQMQNRYNEKLSDYVTKKEVLQKQFSDYDKAEAAVISEVPQNVQNTILLYADDPSLIVLAAGRNKEVRDKLIKLQNDPVALGKEIGRLESKVKIAAKPRPTIEPSPQVKAPAGKPLSPDEKRFREMFPDAKFI